MEFTNGGKDEKDRDPEAGDEHTDKLQAILSSRSRRSLSSSMRADFRSSSLSRSTGGTNFNIFGGGNPLESTMGSSYAEDDEQALRWAALEKLPTFNRLRASIFQKHTGSIRQVDVQKDLSTADFHHLLDKLHRKAADEDEQLFVKMRQRLDRCAPTHTHKNTIKLSPQYLNLQFSNSNLRVEIQASLKNLKIRCKRQSSSRVAENFAIEDHWNKLMSVVNVLHWF